jgi:ubiquinone/menaquinone biosynthesis C-methylase UbiE
MAAALLRRFAVAPGGRWLDLGCGTGGNLEIAERFAPGMVIGVDISSLGLELAQSLFPRARLVSADISGGLPFTDAAFDVVTIFNVIYHGWVKDDGAALAEVARVLRPGGLLIITEPAFPLLAREWDKAVMGVRRYRRPELIDLCRRAGLSTLFASYFTSFGFPILLTLRALKRMKALVSGAADTTSVEAAAESKPLPAVLNGSLYTAALAEAILIGAGIAMPFGVTLALVAKRT